MKKYFIAMLLLLSLHTYGQHPTGKYILVSSYQDGSHDSFIFSSTGKFHRSKTSSMEEQRGEGVFIVAGNKLILNYDNFPDLTEGCSISIKEGDARFMFLKVITATEREEKLDLIMVDQEHRLVMSFIRNSSDTLSLMLARPEVNITQSLHTLVVASPLGGYNWIELPIHQYWGKEVVAKCEPQSYNGISHLRQKQETFTIISHTEKELVLSDGKQEMRFVKQE